MPEFLQLLPPPKALAKFFAHFSPSPVTEEIDTAHALGRVTGKPVSAAYPLPSFPRSTVDGYAVQAADTHGAGETLPAYLNLVGEVLMGATPDVALQTAQCALIHTGGMLPEGADAVVMIEYTQETRPGEIEVMRPVADGENVLKVGEDVDSGQEVIPEGTRLRPAEIGGLMALGIISITVTRQPRIGIISTGDEVVPPEGELQPGQVRDINTYTLAALVTESGGMPVSYGIISDELEVLQKVSRQAQAECDAVIITAGSSASVRDLTAQVIDSLGEPGVLVHGVNVRPGKPTILGVCDGVPLIGLPGNPVSALVIASIFVVPVIEKLLGLNRPSPRPSIPARLTLNLASQSGREDWIPVRLVAGEDGYLAEPIFGKSNLIFTLARADGLVRIPPDANGLDAGDSVQVILT